MLKSFLGSAVGVLVLVSASTMAAGVEQSLLEKIEKAQSKLSSTEQRIATKRRDLSTQLNTLEREVLALREKTAVARRLADEKTLSLSKLESRLDSWRQQEVYQQNLLNRFLQQNNLPQDKSTREPLPQQLDEQIAAVIALSDQLENHFFPSWQTADIVADNGVVESLPVLSVGPVSWYWDQSENRAGLATPTDNGLQSDLLLSGSQSAGIEQLMADGEGSIMFDPTLNRALAREQHSESLFEHIAKGGLWAIPILMFALFAVTIALLKVMQLWRLPKLVRFTPAVLKSLLQDPTRATPVAVEGMQKRLLDIGRTRQSPRCRDDQLFMQLQDDKTWLDRWIGSIAITASISPLLGLLGTVSGMIETFKMMTLFGAGDPEVVSGGIAQALITTELGLVVAIPALILNAVLNRRAKSYYTELENFAVLMGQFDESEPSPVEDSMEESVSRQSESDHPAKTQFDAESTQGVPA